MNSGVQDVYNLCWKLEQVLRGVSAPALLDSYEVERRPVAQANVAAALANAQNHFRIDRALGLSDEQGAATNWAAMARLWDDDPAQDGLRAAVYQAVQAQRIGFRHHNIEFGYVYRDGALVPDGAPPYQPLDPIRLYEPMTRPGHPLPHAWIGQRGPQVALGDMVAGGHFLLIAAEEGGPWVQAGRALAARTGLRLRAFTLGLDEGDWLDLRGSWARLRRMDRGGCLIVRPDRYIGFHAPKAVPDPAAVLAGAFAAIAGVADG
jgi:2,4-dichlorophenol 6-monooxygenase